MRFFDCRFVVEDEVYNYVSGRFPPDTETLAKRAVALVKETLAQN
jgi:hypothetical protein